MSTAPTARATQHGRVDIRGRLTAAAVRLLTATTVVLGTLVLPAATAGPAAAVTSSGWNDWACRPSAEHPRPIVLLHGLGGQRFTNWFYQAPRLASAGYCVYSFTYGQTVLGDVAAGLGSVRDGARQTEVFVDRVLASTGATEVDLVGHSGGTVNAAWYLKFRGGADKVDTFVGFGSNFSGSSLFGFTTLLRQVLPWLPVTTSLVRSVCAACLEALEGSELMRELNAGGLTVPGVRYTSIITRLDSVVTPYTNGRVTGPDATTVVLQDACPFDLSGHVAMVVSPNVTTLVLRAIDHDSPPPMVCRPALPIPLRASR